MGLCQGMLHHNYVKPWDDTYMGFHVRQLDTYWDIVTNDKEPRLAGTKENIVDRFGLIGFRERIIRKQGLGGICITAKNEGHGEMG